MDIIETFDVKREIALEFGVEYGYSISALSNYFDSVIGVDTFEGDIHSGYKQDHFESTSFNLKDFNNIKLIKSNYKDFILNNKNYYDLIHIDIVHNYEDTYKCGEWAVKQSKIVIFHDTESYAEVKKVCFDLYENFNLKFYNYKNSFGLGILINELI